MPTTEQHLAQAATNERLALAWEATDPEWAATALFYAALHYVDAFFYLDGQINQNPDSFRSHSIRDSEVARRLNPVFAAYKRLSDVSREARYDCIPFNTGRVQRLRESSLFPIKRHVETELQILDLSP